jgi:D-glucuronyl C5-epimerase C-terminus
MFKRHIVAALVLPLAVALVGPPNAAGSVPSAAAQSSAAISSGSDQPPAADEFSSDLEQGVGLSPSRGTTGVQQLKQTQDTRGAARRSLAPPVAVPLATFRTSGIIQRPVRAGQRPYDNVPIPNGLTDSSGVRMFVLAGNPTVYNHPVGQANLALAFLDNYRRTGNTTYLRRAEANAQRLIDRRVESRGAWYFPYDFDFAVHGDATQTLKAPWYSGMAQGLALSTFTRLFQVTKDPAWKAAADATFTSLDTGPVSGEPFGSWVSSAGDLWLEEYPRTPVANSERVLNGHIYAAFGVYDYAQLTGSARAKRLYDGALTTVTRYLLSDFRTPQWASLYSLRHRLPTTSYHQKHVVQMLHLQHQTGRSVYTSWATTLRGDFPDRTAKGFAVITPSTTTIYQLDAARKVVGTRAVKFARSTGAPVDRRERAKGGPIMLRVAAGAYTNWWFPEAYSKARIRGAIDAHFYDPGLTGTFAKGMKVGAYKYGAGNTFVAYKTLTFTRSSQAPVTRSAIVDGRLSYFLPAGAFAGYWVPATPGLTVR